MRMSNMHSRSRRDTTAARLAAAATCLLLFAAPAFAVSTRDLVALAQAGLSDDVLVALVEADRTVFNLDAPRILELRAQGLSERIIIAMLKNGHRASQEDEATAALAPTPPDPPSLVVIGEHTPPPVTVQQTNVVVVPWVPVVTLPAGPPVPVPSQQVFRGFGRFINNGCVDRWVVNTGWVERRPHSSAR